MNSLELFAGIGGFALASEQAGCEVTALCELDDEKRWFLERRFPDAKIYRDVRTLCAGELGTFDIITGGFPCQDVSDGGIRVGIEGKHTGLWSEFARLIREIRPRFALMENVPGLLSRGFGTVLGDLAASGYDAEWDCIPAAAFGAAHLRTRLWILAYPVGERLQTGQELTYFAGQSEFAEPDWWPTEPTIPRVDDGLPARVVEAAGNSLIPEIAKRILARTIE